MPRQVLRTPPCASSLSLLAAPVVHKLGCAMSCNFCFALEGQNTSDLKKQKSGNPTDEPKLSKHLKFPLEEQMFRVETCVCWILIALDRRRRRRIRAVDMAMLSCMSILPCMSMLV